MNNNLPNEQIPQSYPGVIAPREKYFPSIYRFITERLISVKLLHFTIIIITCLISVLLVIRIIQQSTLIRQNLDETKGLKAQREQIIGELKDLKVLEPQYTGYRDIYFRIATLNYQLGNIDESKKYIKKALEVDPNFKEGQVLGEKVGV
jgi:tetratricopeptide (TPR) repeat protein